MSAVIQASAVANYTFIQGWTITTFWCLSSPVRFGAYREDIFSLQQHLCLKKPKKKPKLFPERSLSCFGQTEAK